jgi:integrase
MASVCNRPNGLRWIQFSDSEGRRQTLRLGKFNAKDAGEICRRVEMLLAAQIGGTSIDRETAEWVAGIGAKIRSRLVKFGLIEKPIEDKAPEATLDAFLDDYLVNRKHELKPSTRCNLECARRNLVAYFGADKPLSEITPGDADEWRLWLRRSRPAKPGEPKPPGLGENTARRTCGRAKQFFKAAKKKHLIADNPFSEIGDCQVRANKSRDRFITRAEAQKVLDACPNAQWRLLFALSRFGGLRCPSEHAGLRWADVDFEAGKFTVHSPKTEHHEGHESRVVPIFAELRPYLEAARAEAAKDAEFVITIKTMRSPKPNPRTSMEKIVKRAGLIPWPKLFHNLRATRQTELSADFPEHVVCQWIGNSKAVAREHYLRVTDADYAKAAGRSDAKSDATNHEKATHKATVHTSPQTSTLGYVVQKCLEDNGFGDAGPVIRELLLSLKAPPVGLEPTTQRLTVDPMFRRKQAFSQGSDASYRQNLDLQPVAPSNTHSQ